jgi:hypothetical protein
VEEEAKNKEGEAEEDIEGEENKAKTRRGFVGGFLSFLTKEHLDISF